MFSLLPAQGTEHMAANPLPEMGVALQGQLLPGHLIQLADKERSMENCTRWFAGLELAHVSFCPAFFGHNSFGYKECWQM